MGLLLGALDVGDSVVGFPLGPEVGCLVGSGEGRFDGFAVGSAVLGFSLGFEVGCMRVI